MAATSSSENEIRSWLKFALKDENLKDISVKIQGNSEKGDGYMGDIVFVSAEGITDNQASKKYDLVLKCSKKSKAFRETSPVKEAFFNEIFMYQEVFPYFIQYQKEKGIAAPFNSVPKCYGFFTRENMEVIVLENLKSGGYELWPKKQPLSRKHIDLVVTEYGKYHATSLALQHQRPTEFHKFVDSISDIMEIFAKTSDIQNLFATPIDESYDLLKDDLDDSILVRWKEFKTQIKSIFEDLVKESAGIRVILHGDCWNNNFMFLHRPGEDKIPLKVAFLDWQVFRYASPIVDLSYFLFACISKDDLENLDDILVTYHTSFVNQLIQLGIENPDMLYPLNQFLNEWNDCCKYGILMAPLIMKIVSTDKDEVLDVVQVAESGKDFTHSFLNETKDKENYKRRIRPIVEYAARHNLI
ncbi:hypothetical protein Zmor_001691 [Zophobas morio]|uniref:CHK kinase-like domain-containing protein n=1 Tax=Zophobas morio TaxID=2755281 RepID=A0AA38IZI2_9CUCU|nr:hypothetical protein Zmor_001691 [Zophobas morio]